MIATVVRGAKTNRIRVKRSKSPGSVRKRYRQDPAVRGLDTTVVCISMPIAELEQLDAMAERVHMARSHFIRQAVKHFGEKVFQGGQAQRWKETLR